MISSLKFDFISPLLKQLISLDCIIVVLKAFLPVNPFLSGLSIYLATHDCNIILNVVVFIMEILKCRVQINLAYPPILAVVIHIKAKSQFLTVV